mgnify:CR=1 FL=1
MKKKSSQIFRNYAIIFFIIILFICLVLLYKYSRQHIVNQGLNKKNIIFGQSCSLSKSNSRTGIRYSFGYILAFQKLNREGGINNHNLELIVYDDENNSDIAFNNIKILTEYFNVFAIIGSIGDVTSTIIQDYLLNKKIPFVQPLTGVNLLRDEFNEYIVHTKPSYYNEIFLIFKVLKQNNKRNISILFQNDNFGLSVLKDINSLMSSKEYINYFSIISTGSYESADLNIDNGIAKILDVKNIYNTNEVSKSQNIKNIEAIILVSTYDKTSIAINYFKILKPELYIYMTSIVALTSITDNLHHLSNTYTDNIYASNSMPDMAKQNPKLMKEIENEINIYQTANKNTKTYYTDIDPKRIGMLILEGYLNGLFIIEILKNIKNNDYSRQNFINEIYNKSIFKIEGLTYGPFYRNSVCAEKKIDKRNCPCNVGLRSTYLNKYNTKSGEFIWIDRLDNLDCNKIN